MVSDWLITKGCGSCPGSTSEFVRIPTLPPTSLLLRNRSLSRLLAQYSVGAACSQAWCHGSSSDLLASTLPGTVLQKNGCNSNCNFQSTGVSRAATIFTLNAIFLEAGGKCGAASLRLLKKHVKVFPAESGCRPVIPASWLCWHGRFLNSRCKFG